MPIYQFLRKISMGALAAILKMFLEKKYAAGNIKQTKHLFKISIICIAYKHYNNKKASIASNCIYVKMLNPSKLKHANCTYFNKKVHKGCIFGLSFLAKVFQNSRHNGSRSDCTFFCSLILIHNVRNTAYIKV